MTVIPTGIDVKAFASADGRRFRQRFKLPDDALIIGHVGRLALEKNLGYLAEAVALHVAATPKAWFVVVGDGPWREPLRKVFERHGCIDRLLLAGKRTGRVLREAYRAMDIFAFASLSETQGMVVGEAMAAGVPVVALNASGIREVVRNEHNGLLLPSATPPDEFAAALNRLARDAALRRAFGAAGQATAKEFSRERCASRVIAFYEEIRRATRARRLMHQLHPWAAMVKRLGLEWDLLSTRTQTLAAAVFNDPAQKAS